jgi:flavin-dependent dehydrogenase
VGVGYFKDTRKKPPTTNLRELLARFVETFPPARALFQDSRPLTDVRGAPLRTALAGARLSLPGLFVVGEAAGLTYSFSGEGIGKAIESGMIAAESISAAFSTSLRDKSAIAHAYAQRIVSHFEDRFGAYRLAQGWLASPMIANFLAWRANSGDYVRTQMEALLNETADPRVLFSAGGLLRSLSRWTANARRRTPGRPRCSSASTRSSPRLMSPWS